MGLPENREWKATTMIWVPPPWIAFSFLVFWGIVLFLAGLIRWLPWYGTVRADDPTAVISYLGRLLFGILLIGIAVWRYWRVLF
jgi:hypothetical protein